jgi:hypothetical protein
VVVYKLRPYPASASAVIRGASCRYRLAFPDSPVQWLSPSLLTDRQRDLTYISRHSLNIPAPSHLNFAPRLHLESSPDQTTSTVTMVLLRPSTPLFSSRSSSLLSLVSRSGPWRHGLPASGSTFANRTSQFACGPLFSKRLLTTAQREKVKVLAVLYDGGNHAEQVRNPTNSSVSLLSLNCRSTTLSAPFFPPPDRRIYICMFFSNLHM